MKGHYLLFHAPVLNAALTISLLSGGEFVDGCSVQVSRASQAVSISSYWSGWSLSVSSSSVQLCLQVNVQQKYVHYDNVCMCSLSNRRNDEFVLSSKVLNITLACV